MNPYVINGPVVDGRLFFGRAGVFEWVQANLDAFPLRQLLVLSGPARIGKTSVLKQLELGRLGRKVLPVYIDLPQLSADSLSLFYRALAETAVAALQPTGVEFPEMEQSAFVNDPLTAFANYILQPTTAALSGRKLLFLLDNVTQFIERIDDGYLDAHTLANLDHLLRRLPQVYVLYALETSPEAVLSEQLTFLSEAQYYELAPLSPEMATALIREPVRYTVVKDVASYIYDLTAGQPHQIQILCHALYERQVQYGLSQITVADVVAVYRRLKQEMSAHVTAVPLPEYTPNSLQLSALLSANGSGSYMRPPRWLWLLLAVPLLIVSIAGIMFVQRQQALREAALAVAPTAIMSVTETAVSTTTPTATVTPSPIVVVVPSTRIVTATPSPTVPPTITPTPTPTPSPTRTPTITPTPDAYPTEITRDEDGMRMVYVPAGSFLMGSAAEDVTAGADEKPQHLVVLNHFYMDKYEVSVAQYAAFLNQLGGYERACDQIDCTLPRERIGYTNYLMEQDLGDGTTLFSAMTGFANYPANHISWYGAAAYCEYVGGRLPTEAEWEYAARGDDGRIYPWGNTAPNETRAVFQSQSFEDLKPVDALPDGASPFGALGMAGSMWEWTFDWYDEDYYANSPTANPTGPETGLTKAVRGGAWPNNNEADRIRSANRLALDPVHISSTVGFRCVVEP
ncbi:MAG: SUMF1/EgtB/PvdO family nonheme iron enzyme [Chloroflexota bacterium]